MNSPLVSVIVLNWSNWKDTVKCLDSLARSTYRDFEVIVVDNGSVDDSPSKIREYFRGDAAGSRLPNSRKPDKTPVVTELTLAESEAIVISGSHDQVRKVNVESGLTLIVNDKNYGYAEGNNIGIRYSLAVSSPDYVLVLNNDTVVDDGMISELVGACEAEKSIGFAGPKVYRYDPSGSKRVIDFAGGRIDLLRGIGHHIGIDEADNGQYDARTQVDFVEGSCMMVRTEMIRKIGMLDRSYFAYFEDCDWCVRGSENGYKSVYVPEAVLWHKVSSSSHGTMKTHYLTRNRFLFERKHASLLQYLVFAFRYLLYESIVMTLAELLRDKDSTTARVRLKAIVSGVLTQSDSA